VIAPSTFDAVVFVGYHAREGAAEAALAHPDKGRVVVKLNGVEVPEAGFDPSDSKKQRPPMPELVIPSKPAL
jgi:D-aminopeptidase